MRVVDARAGRGEWDYATNVRGVVVPLRSPDEADPTISLRAAGGLLGVAARVVGASLDLLGVTPRRMMLRALRNAWPREHHGLLRSLTLGEIVEQHAVLEQIGIDWRSRVRAAVAESLATVRAPDERAEASPARDADPGSRPGRVVIEPGGALHGHPVGRARTREMGAVHF